MKQADSDLFNEDLRPTTDAERTWNTRHMAALWVGMVACVPTYMLAGGLIELGMNWWQAVLSVGLGNLIVLVPMLLCGHAGAKYGIPFPVLARASFGTRGANIAALLRGLVACGWFGIQTWIGGSAIYQLLLVLFGAGGTERSDLPLLGINALELVCFAGFWLLQVAIVWRGIESIRVLETWAAPFLILMGLALLAWAWGRADGLGAMLETRSAFGPGGDKEGQFLGVFLPGLTGMVGFWATLSLNIPDFTRYATSQRAQALGQTVGLPVPMMLFSFLGVAVTSATVVIFGEPIPDPTELLGRLEGGPAIIAALIALTLATLSTNLAANVVSPANALVNLSPQRISFRLGGLLTAVLGAVILPWKLIESSQGYIFTWLVGYSALLGPIGGILLADYYLLRNTQLDSDGLYRHNGPYGYRSGYNLKALVALLVGVLPNVPGFLVTAGVMASAPAFLVQLYTYSWFVGFFVSGGLYLLLMRKPKPDARQAAGAAGDADD